MGLWWIMNRTDSLTVNPVLSCDQCKRMTRWVLFPVRKWCLHGRGSHDCWHADCFCGGHGIFEAPKHQRTTVEQGCGINTRKKRSQQLFGGSIFHIHPRVRVQAKIFPPCYPHDITWSNPQPAWFMVWSPSMCFSWTVKDISMAGLVYPTISPRSVWIYVDSQSLWSRFTVRYGWPPSHQILPWKEGTTGSIRNDTILSMQIIVVLCQCFYMGVSINGGYPKWLVFEKSHSKIRMIRVGVPRHDET